VEKDLKLAGQLGEGAVPQISDASIYHLAAAENRKKK